LKDELESRCCSVLANYSRKSQRVFSYVVRLGVDENLYTPKKKDRFMSGLRLPSKVDVERAECEHLGFLREV
jgi:hypothetical protein